MELSLAIPIADVNIVSTSPKFPAGDFRGCPPETFSLPLLRLRGGARGGVHQQEKGAEEVVGGHPQAPTKGASPLVESPLFHTSWCCWSTTA